MVLQIFYEFFFAKAIVKGQWPHKPSQINLQATTIDDSAATLFHLRRIIRKVVSIVTERLMANGHIKNDQWPYIRGNLNYIPCKF